MGAAGLGSLDDDLANVLKKLDELEGRQGALPVDQNNNSDEGKGKDNDNDNDNPNEPAGS